MSDPICKGFDGNPDLYGLGIRVGVYLQWFSSWLSVSFEPKSAQSTHDANSVLIFAILIAIFQAAASSAIRPIEAFIMTMICSGYLFTVLSILGLRLQLLGSGRLARLLVSIRNMIQRHHDINKKVSENILAKHQPGERRSLAARLTTRVFNVPIGAISFLKQDSLSWGGVLWRGIIAGMVVFANIWLWFTAIHTLPSKQSPASCRPVIFLFSRQELTSVITNFFRVMSILYGAVICFLLAYIIAMTIRLFAFFHLCVYRVVTFNVLEFIRPGIIDKIRGSLKGFKGFGPWIEFYAAFGGLWIELLFPFVKPEFWATPVATIPRISDLLKVLAVLFSGNAFTDRPKTNVSPRVSLRFLVKFICAIWHTWILLSIVWFILCIELTIKFNHIESVHELKSTGQLIPFVIGVISSCQAIQRTLLVLIKNTYKDWASTDLAIRTGITAYITFEIIKRKEGGEREHDNLVGTGAAPIQDFATGAWV